jgi:hypothetical protein
LGKVCVTVDGPVTLHRPAGGGPRRIFGHGGRKRSLSVRLRRPVGDALTYCLQARSVVNPVYLL